MAMQITEETIDIYLFDYYEGNLNENEVKFLLDEINKNSVFQKEFSCWKLSYQKPIEPVVPTTKLENKLILKYKIPFYYWDIGLASIFLLCWFLPYNKVSHKQDSLTNENSYTISKIKKDVKENKRVIIRLQNKQEVKSTDEILTLTNDSVSFSIQKSSEKVEEIKIPSKEISKTDSLDQKVTENEIIEKVATNEDSVVKKMPLKQKRKKRFLKELLNNKIENVNDNF